MGGSLPRPVASRRLKGDSVPLLIKSSHFSIFPMSFENSSEILVAPGRLSVNTPLKKNPGYGFVISYDSQIKFLGFVIVPIYIGIFFSFFCYNFPILN